MAWARLEDEVVGSRLVGAPTESSKVRTRNMTRCIVVILLLTVLGCGMLILDEKEEGSVLQHETRGEVTTKSPPPTKSIISSSTGSCGNFCQARLTQRRKRHGGDFLSNDDLLQLATRSQAESVAALKLSYGEEHFAKIFQTNGRLRQTMIGANKKGPSIKRFQRKLQMKILEVQAAIQKENAGLKDGCDCNGDSQDEQRRRLDKNNTLPSVDDYFANFVWATGGHSASAGHGNLHSESYTAFMEVTAKPAFDTIGILFEGRNYGMGGMSSAPQLALCNEAVYGTDADVISWDFGMTDGQDFFRKALFASRVGVHRNRPALVEITLIGKTSKDRIEELRIVESDGLTTLRMVDNLSDSIHKEIPDMFGLTQEQIDAIPPNIRDFKCQGQIENGEPTCKIHKWSPDCAERKHKTSWHPGWRVNALYGHGLGLFLVDALIEAIRGLGPNDYDPTAKLQKLKSTEDTDYEKFFGSTISPKTSTITGLFNSSISKNIDPMVFFRNKAICRTALLPAESRYKGYMTGVVPPVDDTYEKGTPLESVGNTKADGVLRIVMDQAERQEWCPIKLKIDFQDYFYASQDDGEVKLTFPNDAELEAYGPWEPNGIIAICFVLCPWGRCPPGNLNTNDLNDQLLDIAINGIAVTKLWSISAECAVAEGKDGWYFAVNKKGRYEVSVKVTPSSEKALAYTRITSIMAL